VPGQSCPFTVTTTIDGNAITFAGTVSRSAGGTVVTASNLTITGGAFGTPGMEPILTAQDRSNITDSLFNAFNQVGGGIFDTDGTSIFGTGGVNNNGIAFMPTALSLGAAPESDNPFDRQFGLTPGSRAEQRHDVTTNASFDFRLDLNALRRQTQTKALSGPGSEIGLAHGLNLTDGPSQALSLGGHQRTYKDAVATPTPRFNAWVSGKYVDFDDEQQNADRSGHLWWVTSGMSYRVGERITLGGFGRVRKGQADSTSLQSSLDSDFYGGGLFGAFTTHGGARLLAAGLYETSDSDIIIQGVTGSFDANQWTVETQIDKRFRRNRAWIEPAVKVLYTETDRDAYTDSAGNRIAGSTLRLGRLTYGPTVGTTIAGHGRRIAEVRPFAKVAGVWDFENEGDFTLSTGAVFSTAETGITVGGGVEVELVRGTILSVAGDWFTYEGDLRGWSVKGGLGTSLAALGLGNVAPTGLVSLDFATTAESQSAKAKVTVPLN